MKKLLLMTLISLFAIGFAGTGCEDELDALSDSFNALECAEKVSNCGVGYNSCLTDIEPDSPTLEAEEQACVDSLCDCLGRCDEFYGGGDECG